MDRNERKKRKLLGFRSNKAIHKIIAVIYYIISAFLIFVFLLPTAEEDYSSDRIITIILTIIGCLSFVLPYLWLSDIFKVKVKLANDGKKVLIFLIAVLMFLTPITTSLLLYSVKLEIENVSSSQEYFEEETLTELDNKDLSSITFKISYKEGENSKNSFDIFIDDLKIGTINKGQSEEFTANISEGKHKLIVKNGRHKEDCIVYCYEYVTVNIDLEVYNDNVMFIDNTVYNNKSAKEGIVRLFTTTNLYEGDNIDEVEKSLKNNGFTNIIKTEKITTKCENNTVEEVFIDGYTLSSAGEEFKSDVEVEIVYYKKTNDNSYNNDYDSDEMDESVEARMAFQKYCESIYPYGVRCHWMTGLICCEKKPEGYYFIKVYITVENLYGNKYETIAEARVEAGVVSHFYEY